MTRRPETYLSCGGAVEARSNCSDVSFPRKISIKMATALRWFFDTQPPWKEYIFPHFFVINITIFNNLIIYQLVANNH